MPPPIEGMMPPSLPVGFPRGIFFQTEMSLCVINMALQVRHRRIRRFEKKIPDEVLGVKVADKIAPGMEGLLEWLKRERIHKYYPFFSHLSYEDMLSLDDENLNKFLKTFHGSTDIPPGARRKLLTTVDILRHRVEILESLDLENVEESCKILINILKTPICEYAQEKNGEFLTALIMRKITSLVDLCRNQGRSCKQIKILLQEYVNHPSILEYDKSCARVWLKYIERKEFYRYRNCIGLKNLGSISV